MHCIPQYAINRVVVFFNNAFLSDTIFSNTPVQNTEALLCRFGIDLNKSHLGAANVHRTWITFHVGACQCVRGNMETVPGTASVTAEEEILESLSQNIYF